MFGKTIGVEELKSILKAAFEKSKKIKIDLTKFIEDPLKTNISLFIKQTK